MSRPSTEAIYVVRVVSKGTGQGALPSERRYSATTVGGLAAVHAILALTLLLLGSLHVAFTPPAHGRSPEVEIATAGGWDLESGRFLVTLSASSWVLASVCITVGPVITGVLSWKQWYLEANLRRFLAASAIAFTVSSASVAITAATLLLQPHIHGSRPRDDPILAGYVYHSEEASSSPFPCDLEGPGMAPCNDSVIGGDSPADVSSPPSKTNRSLLPSLAANATVAALLEALACLASLRVAWAGVKKSGDVKENVERTIPSPIESLPPIRIAPDIVPCESTREYEERMRRFVADAGVIPETIGR